MNKRAIVAAAALEKESQLWRLEYGALEAAPEKREFIQHSAAQLVADYRKAADGFESLIGSIGFFRGVRGAVESKEVVLSGEDDRDLAIVLRAETHPEQGYRQVASDFSIAGPRKTRIKREIFWTPPTVCDNQMDAMYRRYEILDSSYPWTSKEEAPNISAERYARVQSILRPIINDAIDTQMLVTTSIGVSA